MKRSAAVITLVASLLLVGSARPAGAAPSNSHSPNLEGTFPVVCDGVTYTLLDAPAAIDRADFTPAFVVGTHQVVIPFSFEATQTAVVLTDGAVIDGTTYNAGDILFSGSESSAIGDTTTRWSYLHIWRIRC